MGEVTGNRLTEDITTGFGGSPTGSLRSGSLQINELCFTSGGRIGLTFCPGKKLEKFMTRGLGRDMDADLDTVMNAGYCGVVTLMEFNELPLYQVASLPDGVLRRGMFWLNAPIGDDSTPDAAFEARFEVLVAIIYANVRRGGAVLMHCKGGIGRAGLIAIRFLIEVCVLSPEVALDVVRRTRKWYDIDTEAQEHYILSCKPGVLNVQFPDLELNSQHFIAGENNYGLSDTSGSV